LGSYFHGTEGVFVNGVFHEFKVGGSGLKYEANEVRKCLKAKQLESDIMPHKDSITIATIEDELRKQLGVQFNVDLIHSNIKVKVDFNDMP
jgi:dihydrodiol dehydrogenase / D-xylose 1-dehydrogenase (NADP)